MDARQKKLADAFAALSDEERIRLERLAELAQSSPAELWPTVQRYGFDDVEDSILADIEAQADHQAGRTISNSIIVS